MTVMWETIAQEGFQFFGKMSASLSHEIKNALAILNENAGLLDDWLMLAERGRPLDPVRLKTMAGKMMQQIHRADSLVKRLNAFAHSADTQFQMIDLATALEPIVSIVQRPAAMAEASVTLETPGKPVLAASYLFLLENLIWITINYLLAAGHKEIKLVPQLGDDGPQIRVIGQFGFPDGTDRGFPGQNGKALIEAMKVKIHLTPLSGEITITLPRGISG
jgi:signal transduction histidine kinase